MVMIWLSEGEGKGSEDGMVGGRGCDDLKSWCGIV